MIFEFIEFESNASRVLLATAISPHLGAHEQTLSPVTLQFVVRAVAVSIYRDQRIQAPSTQLARYNET